MSKTTTFWASRNPEGPYSPRVQLTNFCPKKNTRNPDHWWYWSDGSIENSFVDHLTLDSEKTLGLDDLRAGYARNLNTGEEIHITQAKEI